MPNIRILVADDHSVVRRGVRALLELNRAWKVCGEAVSGADAILKTRKLKPDVVVMDISMPEVSGLEAARQIHSEFPRVQVLILTMHQSSEVVNEVLRSGARGYVTKSDLDHELVAGVEALLSGGTFFSAIGSEVFMQGYLKNGEEQVDGANSNPAKLTVRQREVVLHLAQGKTNKEVAALLGISTKTVEAHRAQIMQKLHLRSFSELVRYALKEKMVES